MIFAKLENRVSGTAAEKNTDFNLGSHCFSNYVSDHEESVQLKSTLCFMCHQQLCSD